MRKALFVSLLLAPFYLVAQDYVDILKISYSENFNSEFEGYSQSTNVKSIDIDFTYPIVINNNNALITGVNYSRNNLELFPRLNQTTTSNLFTNYTGNTSLHTSILKLGLATTFDKKWSGTFVLLPKLASDYINISNDDFYFGGVAILKYKKHERLKYRFGLFAIDQAYGWFTTPIIGLYYISKNSKFEMDISVPVSADINYSLSKNFNVGFDYLGIGRSFDVHLENTPDFYIDYGALEFTCYAQYALLSKSILLRAKLGYADFDAEAYADGDKIDFRVSAFNIGDGGRKQLNPELSSGFIAKIEAVYRFNISAKN